MSAHNLRRLLLATLVAAPVLSAMQAGAQGLARPTGPVVGTAVIPEKAPPPRGLPGSRTSGTEAAPGDRLASDMKPNEALFDAINRGDMAAARDAIGRGADPDAHNILGLTPVDLAVDLGRNEITFLLLALRGTGSAGAAARGPSAGSSGGPAAAALAQREAPARPQRVATSGAARAPTTPAPTRRVTGGDPGVPAPQAGFLGFGGGALR